MAKSVYCRILGSWNASTILEETFLQLAAQWQRETGVLSVDGRAAGDDRIFRWVGDRFLAEVISSLVFMLFMGVAIVVFA